MRIETPREIGALIRQRRRLLSLDQATLAHKVGVSRQWIVGVEKGKVGAPIGLVFRTLKELGIHLSSTDAPAGTEGRESPIDLDTIISAAKRRR